MSYTPTILIAEDNPDDRLLLEEAWKETGTTKLHLVKDGEELMAFLHQNGKSSSTAALPDLILLDLNMPKKNGFEALEEIKTDPGLQKIPVIVLTTSTAPTDISRSYRLGANSYITKPNTFDGLLELVNRLHHYWFETVRLPG